MSTRHRFGSRLLASIHDATFLRIRAGADHRFIGIWVVVVRGRVFVRSWNNRPDGWYRALLQHRVGAIDLAGRQMAIRARAARGERLMESIETAYAEKYVTPASRFYVRGFRSPRRRKATMELLPAMAARTDR